MWARVMKADSYADEIALEAARDISEITCVGVIDGRGISKIQVRVIDAIQGAMERQRRSVSELSEMLHELAEQHRCECGHPYCNRCDDYRRARAVLERAGF